MNSLLRGKVGLKCGVNAFQSLTSSTLAATSSQTPGYWTGRIVNEPYAVAQAMLILVDAFTQCLSFVVGMGLIFWMSRPLGLLVICVVPLYVYASLRLNPRIRSKAGSAKEQATRLSGAVEECLSGLETVKVLVMEKTKLREVSGAWSQLMDKEVRYNLTVSVGTVAASAIASLAPIGVLWYGGHLVMTGALTLGKLIGINRFLGYVFRPVGAMVGLNARMRDAEVSLERLEELRDLPKEQVAGTSCTLRSNAAIAVQGLEYAYHDSSRSVRVFDGLTAQIAGGKTTAIVGESGCGKSTLLRLVVGLVRPQAGVIFIDGVDISGVEVGVLRRQVCLVPQNAILFTGSILENVVAGTGIGSGEVAETRLTPGGVAGLVGEDAKLPVETECGVRGCMLSGGQRQRVVLARALIRDPAVLLMDEVTSEVDLETEREVLRRVVDIRKGRTTVIVAHRLCAALVADEVIVLRDGKVHERGNHDTLLAHRGEYYRMWRASQGGDEDEAVADAPRLSRTR